MRSLSRRSLFALPLVAALPLAAKPAFATGGVVAPLKAARLIGEQGPEALVRSRGSIVPLQIDVDTGLIRTAFDVLREQISQLEHREAERLRFSELVGG